MCETEERGDLTHLEFRADGAFARRLHHNPDGSEWSATYNYDDGGRLTALTGSGGGVANLQLYEYNDAGKLARVLNRREDGGDRVLESYEYDAAGGKRKTIYVDLAAQRPDTHYAWGVEGTDSTYSAPGMTTFVTLYNERNKPTTLLFHDATGRQLSRVELRYDEAGHLMEEVQTHSEEVLPPEMLASLSQAQLETVRGIFGVGRGFVRRTHAYNQQGLRVESCSHMGQLAVNRKTMAYNEHGDPLEEIYEHETRDYGIDDEGRLTDGPTRKSVSRSEARFRYDYDSLANWVRKTVESRGRTEDEFALSSVDMRTISYFV